MEILTFFSSWEISGSYILLQLWMTYKRIFSNSPRCSHLKVENDFNSTALSFRSRRTILSNSNNGKASLFIVNMSVILRKALKNIITTLCKPFPLICKQEIPFFEVFRNFSNGKIALKSSPLLFARSEAILRFFLCDGALLNIMLLT